MIIGSRLSRTRSCIADRRPNQRRDFAGALLSGKLRVGLVLAYPTRATSFPQDRITRIKRNAVPAETRDYVNPTVTARLNPAPRELNSRRSRGGHVCRYRDCQMQMRGGRRYREMKSASNERPKRAIFFFPANICCVFFCLSK